MTQSRAWKAGPLYAYLLQIFPQHRTIADFLDVRRLARELGLSRQRIYHCLHNSTLTPTNAEAIRTLACAEPNAAVLIAAGRPLPERKDFDPFVYGAA